MGRRCTLIDVDRAALSAAIPVVRRYRRAVRVQRLDGLLAEVQQREPTGAGVRIVGVDGPSGSGKSSLARRIADLSGAQIVFIDDFVSWEDFDGWWPRFDREVLTPLLAGHDARYQVRDWANDELGSSLGGWKTTPFSQLVILDGVTCTRRAAAASLTYRIWVEAPESVRLARGLARDGESHRALWDSWMAHEARFFAEDGTRACADLFVDGHPDAAHDPDTE